VAAAWGATRRARRRAEPLEDVSNSSARVSREGASHCARGGRAPPSSCIVGVAVENERFSLRSEPFANVIDDHPAGLRGGHFGIIDDLCAERDHQRRGGALAVALIAGREILIHTFGGAALGALVEVRVEIKLVIGFGKHIGANVAAFHDEIAKLNALALFLLHPVPDFRHRGDERRGGAHFGRADFFFRIIIADEQMNVAIAVFERGLPFAARGGDGFGVVDIDSVLQAMPGQRAIHGAGIDVNIAEGLRDQFGIGALAARAGAINGDDDRVVQNR
jgi:hypothetical protein